MEPTKGLTAEERAEVDNLVREVDDVTKAMAEEFYLAKVTKDWTSFKRLKDRHTVINSKLAYLFEKRGDLQ